MTEIKKILACDTATTLAIVAATIDFGSREKLVEVRLEGVILSEHTAALRDFLRNISYFPGNKWTLQLENLELISMRPLRALTRFAHVLRRKGCELEIAGIQPAILATILDLGLNELFSWERMKHHSHLRRVASGHKFSAMMQK
ncbi:MAG: hypothetical protein ONB44_19170 [candidate division KSB1 bacterium]|nr:hypothetical protein [candidate division KSB1 bacterium]MDZ7304251.1 hypothetical protein [candidate division KSB1 bacterium]MDZ7311726.1 hypothetical protein [candidate division KSB1 bacterium]